MVAPPIARLIGKLFARPLSRRDRRVPRLGVESLEARDVPAVTFGIEKLSDATEGGAAAQFRVTATGDSFDFSAPVYAIWDVTGGTATFTNDYTVSPARLSYLVFNSSGATATVTVTAVDDTDVEGDETVSVMVQRYQMYPTGPQSTCTLTIHDNDTPPPPPPPVVSVAVGTDATEGGTHGTFVFTRTGETTSALTVTYTVPTGSGYATPGDDYTELTGTVTIAAGDSTATVEVDAGIDLLDPGEVVAVTISTDAAYTIGSGATAECDVVEDLTDPATLTWVLNRYYSALGTAITNLSATEYASDLSQMLGSLADMLSSALGQDWSAYETAYGQYSLTDLNRSSDILEVEEKANAIIADLITAVSLAENDAFRIKAFKAEAEKLRAYLTARQDQLNALQAGLLNLYAMTSDSRLSAAYMNVGLDQDTIAGLLEALDEIEYQSLTDSDDPRVTGDENTTGLNELSEDVKTALDQLDTQVGTATDLITAIRDKGAQILGAAAGPVRDGYLFDYSHNLITSLALGNGPQVSLNDLVDDSVNEIVDKISEAASLISDIDEDVGVSDDPRFFGLLHDLDEADAKLASLSTQLQELLTQLNQISALYPGPVEDADCMSARNHLTNMINEIGDQRTKISDLRDELTGGPP